MRNILLFLSLFIFAAPSAYAITQPFSTDSAKTRILMERKEARLDFQKLMQEKKAAMQLKTQTEREEFKEKLALLKDQRKKLIVERVDLKLSTINQNASQRLSLAIEKLEKLLDKFSTRAESAKSSGQNTSEVDAAIVAAEAAIETAKIEVATQSAKVYTAEITTEGTLKQNVGQEVSSLRHDLKTVHDVVKLAKQKVMDVARALAKLHLENQTATPSATVETGI